MAMNKNGYGCVLALCMVRGCRSFVCLCYCQLVALAGCVDRWGDGFIGERAVSSRFLSASHCVKGSRAAGHQPPYASRLDRRPSAEGKGVLLHGF